MKGVILAGGLGTRMRPLTITTNKHLLPVYDQQMILFPLQTLVNSGIKDILITTDKNFVGEFSKLLGSGKDYGCNICYRVQENPKGGIADALKLAKDFASGESVMIILGDNIFEDILNPDLKEGKLAKVFLKKVVNPRELGVAEVKNESICNILEKPENPPSDLAVTGAYIFPNSVFEVIDSLIPSKRGELEITDVNNYYAKRSELCFEEIKGFWADAGTFDGLFECSLWRKNAKITG